MSTRSASLILASAMALVTLAPAFAAKPAQVTNKTTKITASAKKPHKAKTQHKKAAVASVKKAK